VKPSTLVWLALAGTRTDALRVALTAVSAVLAALFVLSAATVLSIDGIATRYSSNLLAEPGLRPGVALALLLLTVPVFALAAQCGRLGAPARDRRLAAVRLAGATPRQVLAIVATETGVAAGLGMAVALALFLIARRAVHDPGNAGGLALPTDVLPAPGVLATVTIALPLVATAVSALLLRRVSVTPFGVVRRASGRAPGPWPALLIAPALAAFAVFEPLNRLTDDLPAWILPVVGGLCGTIGVVLGTGWLSATGGRLLHRWARTPDALLAARRLIADPWAGSRTFAALLACVVFGAGAVTVRAWFHAHFDAEARISIGQDTDSYFRALDLVDAAVMVGLTIAAAGLLVAIAEGIASRRRTYAALAAVGVPRARIARSLLWQVLVPVVPALLLALAVGASLIRGIATADESNGASRRCDPTGCVEATVGTIPIPLGDLAIVGAAGLVAVLAVVGASLVLLRSSTSIEELRTG
jgi:FtsX-like permease family